ncbi:hypothetical protein AgCh_038257 [Apium graveolens]
MEIDSNYIKSNFDVTFKSEIKAMRNLGKHVTLAPGVTLGLVHILESGVSISESHSSAARVLQEIRSSTLALTITNILRLYSSSSPG